MTSIRYGCIALLCAVRAGAQIRTIDDAVARGMSEHLFPGAVLVVGRADTILYAKGYGHLTWSASGAVPSPVATRWDLASLSKIVGPTSAMAVLFQQHRIELDSPVTRYLPQFHGGGKDAVTVRMLLNHTSGMPSYTRLWLVAHTPEQAREKLFEVPLRQSPGKSAEYSDLNAMLAGLVVEHIAGKPLDRFVDSAVFIPLGMRSSMYRPTGQARELAAPTGQYHGHPVGGIVNDQNAVALGGVSGHAGVFATGLDLARFAQAWLAAANGKGDWIKRSTAAEFLQHSATSGSRVLGWDTPDPPHAGKTSLYGRCATGSTFGHTGWTGTEMWFDPAQNLFVVFLTNRSFAPANPKESFLQLKEIRLAVADAVRAVWGVCRT